MEIRFVLTAACNFRCVFCLNEFTGPPRDVTALSPADYGEMAREACSSGWIKKVTLTGGEPFLRPDFSDILSEVRRASELHLTAVSNGALLHKHVGSIGLLDELHVSCHSLREERWPELTRTGGKAMDRVLNNLESVRDAYPELPVRLNIVADRSNDAEAEAFIELARRLDLTLVVFKEGYDNFRRLAREIHKEAHYREPSEFWDLSRFGPILLRDTGHKRYYEVGGVSVVLSYTSTDRVRWDAIWVSPEGLLFCDPEHRSDEVDILQCLHNGSVGEAYASMRAEMASRASGGEGLEEVLRSRGARLGTARLTDVLRSQEG